VVILPKATSSIGDVLSSRRDPRWRKNQQIQYISQPNGVAKNGHETWMCHPVHLLTNRDQPTGTLTGSDYSVPLDRVRVGRGNPGGNFAARIAVRSDVRQGAQLRDLDQ
jgi:hypothetical protein